VEVSTVAGTGRGGRVLKEDVQKAAAAKPAPAPSKPAPAQAKAAPAPAKPAPTQATGERERREKMRPLRKTIAARLVEAQQTAAILTTFNEVDMSAVMQARSALQKEFVDAHGIKLGFMSFFVKAAVSALRAFPSVNAEIDGDEIIYKQYYNIGVAVGGGKGLVVPVIRDADALGFAAIEQEIGRLAGLARDNKLTLSHLSEGSFTISNGGIYGSMLSTPILNSPQTGILGLHNIVQRPVAIDGKVEIRPIMYLALSYDHRLVDGREAVQFLVHVKQAIEDPRRLLLEI
jgi:2-oxoglutarate dehydrogenase E2 component (dihydrolipoamide succinyltransferase)